MSKIIYIIVALTISAMARANVSDYADKSVLSEGKWVKIRINETGFYKITYSELKDMGFSDPEKISVYGYGGWPMEEDFSKAEYIDDLPPVALWRGPDYILFHGKGPVKWTYGIIGGTRTFSHENNPYSVHGFYFITDSKEKNEAASISSSQETATVHIESYDDYMLHEKDEVSVTTAGRPYSGRDLFGENFGSNSSQDFTFSIPGITDEDGKIAYRFVAKSINGPGLVTMSVDGRQLSENKIYQNTSAYVAALSVSPVVEWTGTKDESVKISISFKPSGNTSHLDYIRLQMKRRLRPYGAYTFFRSLDSRYNVSQFNIADFSPNILIFDVTDGQPMQKIEPLHNSTQASFTIPAGNLREFALVDISKPLPSPEVIGEVTAQNLHGMQQTDMIILSPQAFTGEAERLAAAHRLYSGLSVAVVTPEQVYNEFSSGTPEATAIRRFMKMLYDRSTPEKDAPKYLLLFGDGRYDNRKLTNTWKSSGDNYIITYQSKESLGQDSYVSDDYFGFLQDNEGGNPITASIDLGIGRFPVNTLTQAKNAVDKVISYMEEPGFGKWKNNLCFVADDGNSADQYTTRHMEQSDSLTRYLEYHHPEFLTKKLFFDTYKLTYKGGKPSYPDIRTNIQKELKNGVMLINYTGHGDRESWAEEKVMTETDIKNATYQKLPLWITAACDFAPFDSHKTSAGEYVFLNKNSGGIALFTTARVAYREPNFVINRLFLKYLFEKKDGRHLTFGEVMKHMKQEYKSKEKLSFVLLGDPALKLPYPDEYKVNITEINGKAVSGEPVKFKALEKIEIKGQVNSSDGGAANYFNGLLSITVFDSQSQITTLDNNNTGNTFSYHDYPNVIYIGNDSVQNGAFSFSFTVPKDIYYSNDKGKISFYALDDKGKKDANGVYKNFTVGGTSEVIESDIEGPEIRMLYLNTEDFKDGNEVNDTPVFAAVVWDKSGVNTGSSSIGHDITLTIDNNPVLSYALNDYYETYLSGQEGEGIIKFPVPKLEPGKHSGVFKIWDVQNNSSEQAFDFIVKDNYEPAIIDLIAAPSPARESVHFIISHDIPETLMKVEIQVYDITGRLQWRYQETGASEIFNSYEVKWDLTNGAGSRLRPGIYAYRAIISTENSKEASKSKKLIIHAQ